MSAKIAGNSVLRTLRQLISEFRNSTSCDNLKESLFVSRVLSQYKRHRITDLQLCKAQEEMKTLAQVYVCYLRSQREYNELHQQYTAKGERTVESTAKMVGFKLPHES